VTQRDDLEGGVHRLGADVALPAGTRLGLFEVLAGENAEGDRDLEPCRKIRQSVRHSMSEHVEMQCLAAYQAAKRDHGVEASGRGDRCDRGRELERARNLEFLDIGAEREPPSDRPLGEAPRDFVVPAGANDRHPGADKPVSHSRGRLPTPRHLAQSSPRMTPLWVAR
jgi:hypothetical protein